MIRIDDNGFFEIFPAIKTITEAFEYQNAMLNKIVLTGKINALEIAENLFDFTEQTADTFAILQEKLIENLLEENKKSIELKAKLKIESILAILIKNLYETSKNIELLSQNRDIIEFLNSNISKNEITRLLNEYVSKYSIYNEVLIISPDKKIKANINPKNKVLNTKDSIIDEVLASDTFLQAYKKTDMFIVQKKSLFFAKRVVDDEGNVKGAVVLFFDLENEMKNVFEKILSKNEEFYIVNKFSDIIASSEVGINNKFLKSINKTDKPVISKNRFNYKLKAKNYKDYSIDYYGVISLQREADVNILIDSENGNHNIKQLMEINLKNKDLKKLTDEAYSILEDLSDVIINGELIAAKSKQYILIPILDNLREVSFKVVNLIEVSISSLQKVINSSFCDSARSISKFIMFSVLKNMYEITNDVRWWALNRTFINELSKKEPNVDILKNELLNINSVYSNYYNIFLYDSTGQVIATSKSEISNIEDKAVLSNSGTNGFFISEFKVSKFYDNKPTYIFYSPIIKDKNIIGGIGVVFDINELNEILKYIMSEKGFALIVNKKREVIASTSKNIMEKLSDIELKDGNIKDIEIDDVNYKIAVSYFDKYREYQNRDLFVIVGIEK